MRPRLIRPALAVAVAAAALTAVSAGVPASAPTDDVRVTIVAVTASNRHQDINPKLREFAREVQKREPSLSGYRLGQTESRALNVGQKESFKLVDDATADITVLARDDSRQRVRLAVKAPLVGEITYLTCYDKFFPIVTRYLTKNDRDRLIVAVMVKSAAKDAE